MNKKMSDDYAARYPRGVEIPGLDIVLREMTVGDLDVVLAFAHGLPEHDRLFLQRDITQREVVAAWLRELEKRKMAAIMAAADGVMLGYGMVIPSEEEWSAHVAEIRVAVASEARGKGLGRVLAQESFAISLACNVEKMIARMTPDQLGAIAAFEGLGFKAEGLLRDHIIDQAGNRHDLLMMGHDVRRFHGTMQSYGIDSALQ